MDWTPRLELDGREKAVLARTPADAARVRYVAAFPEAFAEAHRARNPAADVLTDLTDLSPCDVIATDDLAVLLARPDATPLIASAAILVAPISPTTPTQLTGLLTRVQENGLEVLHLQPATGAGGYFDDRETDLAAAWRGGALPPDIGIETLLLVARRAPQPAMLHLNMVTYAPTLMDVRTRLPAEAMRTRPDLLVTHQKLPIKLPRVTRDEPKILLLQRPAPVEPMSWRQSMLAQAKAGWIVVLEYDDHPESVARVKGRPVTEADWLRFTHVHAVQTSTPALAELFRQYNPEVKLLPNAVFELSPFPESLPSRVFYGAVSRGPFAAAVAASLAPAIAEFPDTEFVVVGDRAVFDAVPAARKQFHEFVPYDDYLKLMRTCAISLAPVDDSELPGMRSDAKFLDAAAQGVLTIASPAAYSDVIRHETNGLIAATLADWSPELAAALRDPQASRSMARNAWDYVAGARMFAQQIPVREDWYRDLWDRRADLNAALSGR